MFSLICTRINGRVNTREPGDLRRHRTHYDVIVMIKNCALMVLFEGNPPWQLGKLHFLVIVLLDRNKIDGLVQDCSNSIASALELLQSCTKPSKLSITWCVSNIRQWWLPKVNSWLVWRGTWIFGLFVWPLAATRCRMGSGEVLLYHSCRDIHIDKENTTTCRGDKMGPSGATSEKQIII